MEFLNEFLPILLYIAGIVLLIVLIILGIKAIKILDNVEDIVEDAQDKLDEFEKGMNKKYSEEVEKYNILIDGISRKVDKEKQEFHLIKARFTELSEFIKDVRFRRNIHNTFKERKEYRDISTKIDFTKKQKLKAEEITENEDNKDKEKDTNKDILAPFDYYAHFGMERNVQEEDEYRSGCGPHYHRGVQRLFLLPRLLCHDQPRRRDPACGSHVPSLQGPDRL